MPKPAAFDMDWGDWIDGHGRVQAGENFELPGHATLADVVALLSRMPQTATVLQLSITAPAGEKVRLWVGLARLATRDDRARHVARIEREERQRLDELLAKYGTPT